MKAKAETNNEISNYLRREVSRLEKLSDFYSIKVKKHSHTLNLVEEQKEEKEQSKRKLIPIISDRNSVFYKLIQHTFDTTFSSIK